MRMTQKALLIAGLGLLTVGAQAQQRGIELYFVDTEGGAATLIVTPQKESILIDDGNPGTRDAGRIASAAKLAGLKQIDHLIITHWHLDHYGGTEALAKLIPIKHFYDRGIPDADKSDDPQNFPTLIAAYKAASNNKSNRLSPGDLVPLIRADKKGLPIQLKCLCARTEVLTKTTLADYPADANAKPIDDGDNAKSLGFLLSFGKFRFIDLGDLTWNIEYKLSSPACSPGPVDVYQSTHHGLDISNNPALVNRLKPIVAIYNNGPYKGGHPDLTKTLRALPSLQAIWQLHKNLKPGEDVNALPEFIANVEATESCKGNFVHLSVAPDSLSYTVQVGASGKKRTYKTRQ